MIVTQICSEEEIGCNCRLSVQHRSWLIMPRCCGDLFENRCNCQHFQNAPSGIDAAAQQEYGQHQPLHSATVRTKRRRSRFFSDAPWFEEAVNERRAELSGGAARPLHRRPATERRPGVPATRCASMWEGRFEYVDRHYDHSEDRYRLAHNLVTSHYVSRCGALPKSMRGHRGATEEVTQWEERVKKHFPGRAIPTSKKERQRLP